MQKKKHDTRKKEKTKGGGEYVMICFHSKLVWGPIYPPSKNSFGHGEGRTEVTASVE